MSKKQMALLGVTPDGSEAEKPEEPTRRKSWRQTLTPGGSKPKGREKQETMNGTRLSIMGKLSESFGGFKPNSGSEAGGKPGKKPTTLDEGEDEDDDKPKKSAACMVM